MAVQSRDLATPPPLARRVIHIWPMNSIAERRPSIAPLGLQLLVLLGLVAIVPHARTWLDDLRYGRPRTTQVSAVVGLNDSADAPTQFTAMNLNRRVVVLLLPGSDAGKAQILQGPYLFGAQENLTPIALRIADRNRDSKPDLTVAVKQEEIIYLNTGTTFRLITPAERQQITTGGAN